MGGTLTQIAVEQAAKGAASVPCIAGVDEDGAVAGMSEPESSRREGRPLSAWVGVGVEEHWESDDEDVRCKLGCLVSANLYKARTSTCDMGIMRNPCRRLLQINGCW